MWVGSVTMLLAALLTGVVTGGLFVARAGVEGLGYNRVDEIASPLAQAVKALPPEAGVAADDYPKMYWVSGRTSITVIPWTGYHFPPAKAARENDDSCGANSIRKRVLPGGFRRSSYRPDPAGLD